MGKQISFFQCGAHGQAAAHPDAYPPQPAPAHKSPEGRAGACRSARPSLAGGGLRPQDRHARQRLPMTFPSAAARSQLARMRQPLPLLAHARGCSNAPGLRASRPKTGKSVSHEALKYGGCSFDIPVFCLAFFITASYMDAFL